ncbi:hypothetical protein [Robiginitalea aurantiaca]|uniref:CYTH domain-containing protein n=1 Tax=Robiginitalea aurantiaca TaxID=3056915 RepID=A0ABT7WBJ3_9FLAO|nr:hypothetical protein [Robiginitalea aurantiaca]MDM9630278.1 hypothetical protein [Robiginitalea aurantiaca]
MYRTGIPNVQTLEIRWFFEEDRPGLKAIFQGLQPEQYAVESRTDTYLLLPGREDLGIKLRQGRLEIKFRSKGSETGAISGIHGNIECWEKLGFELGQERMFPHLPEHSEASWISVAKKRWVTMAGVTDGEIHYEPPGSPRAESVQVEYTQLGLEGRQWFTLGFEWPRRQPLSLPEPLLRKWVMPEGFTEEISMGYPAFLNGILNGPY